MVKKKSEENAVERSRGRVFASLGRRPSPEERSAKADLAMAIAHEVEARHLTRAEAADLLGVARRDIANLVRGRLSGYSVERLTRLLSRFCCRLG
jgi:predicted XRE-type DNA-binding protein